MTIPSGGVLPKIRPELIGRKHGHLFPNEVSSKLVHASPKPQKVKTPTKVSTPRKKLAKKAKVKTAKNSVSKALAVATAATPSVLLKKVVQISWLCLKAYFFSASGQVTDKVLDETGWHIVFKCFSFASEIKPHIGWHRLSHRIYHTFWKDVVSWTKGTMNHY